MDDSPIATKADIASMGKEIMSALKKLHDDVYRADDEILIVLTNIDKRLTKKVENHERRLNVLERQAV